MSTFTFEGRYFSQPRDQKSGPPHEADLLTDERLRLLREISGWETVFKGSLTLIVPASVVKILGHMHECYFEHPRLIKYPIDKIDSADIRGGYLHYFARISYSGIERDVLVRRGKVLPIDDRVEVYAEEKLANERTLNVGDVATVTVRDA